MAVDRQINDVARAIAALAIAEDPVLTPEAAVGVFAAAAREARDPGSVLADTVQESALLAALARELNIQFIDLYSSDDGWQIADDVVDKLSIELLAKGSAVPLVNRHGFVVLAMRNPFVDRETVGYVNKQVGEDLPTALAPYSQIQAKLAQLDTTDLSALAVLDTDTNERPVVGGQTGNPVVDWVDGLFVRAASERASDVHFLFNEDKSLLVRFRIDGDLVRQSVPPQLRRRESEIIGTLLSKCPTIDPLDKTRPQDGAFNFWVGGGKKFNTRLAMLPQVNGPTVVVRLLDPDNVRRRLDDMGFATSTLTLLRDSIVRDQGLILMVGPTGSGKTTTLYGLLNEVDSERRNVLTAEDPVEYRIRNVGQTPIRNDLGDKSLRFSDALRAFLRLDPDVILVGEIRDRDTAEVAMHASLTGHLVLSTLHANSALGVLPRLLELGVEPFAVSDSLLVAASQRLLKLLHDCKEVSAPTPTEVSFLQRQNLPVPELVARPRAGGCDGCAGKGFRGRVPVLETLAPNDEVKDLIGRGAPLEDVSKAAYNSGYTRLIADGFRHVEAHRTSVSELLKCLSA